MSVKGADKLAQRLRQMPEILKERVKAAIKEGAEQALADMKTFTPLDPANPGAHARDGLTIVYDKDGLAAHIGLPTKELTERFFWFRFLDLGTKGYTPEPTLVRRTRQTDKAGERVYEWQVENVARRTSSASKTTKLISQYVPPRPALHIRERTLDANRDDIERLVRQAVDSMRKG